MRDAFLAETTDHGGCKSARDACAQGLFQGSGWQRWLDLSAGAHDCKLSSHARRAILNLQSAHALAAAQVPLSQLWIPRHAPKPFGCMPRGL